MRDSSPSPDAGPWPSRLARRGLSLPFPWGRRGARMTPSGPQPARGSPPPRTKPLVTAIREWPAGTRERYCTSTFRHCFEGKTRSQSHLGCAREELSLPRARTNPLLTRHSVQLMRHAARLVGQMWGRTHFQGDRVEGDRAVDPRWARRRGTERRRRRTHRGNSEFRVRPASGALRCMAGSVTQP